MTKRILNERSAGAVIFRRENKEFFFLLLRYPAGHWDFVKGKIETGEIPIETVKRETFEETGIKDLEFIDGFQKEIEYEFLFNCDTIHKKVIFFLAETKTKKVSISHEHLDYLWLKYNDALKKITFENAKNVLKHANKFISKTF